MKPGPTTEKLQERHIQGVKAKLEFTVNLEQLLTPVRGRTRKCPINLRKATVKPIEDLVS